MGMHLQNFQEPTQTYFNVCYYDRVKNPLKRTVSGFFIAKNERKVLQNGKIDY